MGSSRPKKIRCVYRARSVKNGRVDNGRRAVLKTVGCKSFAGSNPVPSALNFFVLLTQSGKSGVLIRRWSQVQILKGTQNPAYLR